MGLEDILEMICTDMQHETDCAIELREQSLLMSWYRNGVADGLNRAMVYLELLKEENKKAAMPASTAVDPLEEDLIDNESIAETTEPVKEVDEDGRC